MKLLGRNFENDGSGSVDLVPEDSEDLWHLYNLVAVGDKVKCKTVRKVTTESSTGSTASIKKLITIKIGVQSIDYDTQAGQLRLKGQNEMESEHIRMGAFHTAEIEPHQKLTIEKTCWDALYLDRLQEATDHSARADVAAVILQEGVAHVCLITSNMTIVKQKIETSIPRKRKSGSTQHDKSLLRFYDQILQSIQRNVRWDIVKAFIVASPGFIKDDLFKYIMDEAVRRDIKELLENKGKFVLCHSSSGYKHSLKEVMQDKAVASKLADTKAAGETKALEDFYDMLSNDPDRALYGPEHCFQAAEKDAIDLLMISDSLFRSQDLAQRKRYVTLVEKVRETNGEVKVFSSLHVTGEQLTQLTGVAAILRFPCPEIGNDSDEES